MSYLNRSSSKPVVSVALCTYNGAAYLEPQLQSLARQSRLPDELVVCDDQSTDETARIVGNFAQQAPFPVSLNINPQRLGVTGNFERAFALCQGKFIAPCDQDDLWLPEKLATLARLLEQDATCQASFCDVAIMPTQGGKLDAQTQWQKLGFNARRVAWFNQGHALEMLLRYNVVTGMAMMFRRDLLKLARPLPADFIHDEWLALLAAATGKLVAVNQPLVHYREHGQQSIGPASRNVVKQWRHAREKMGDAYIARQLARTEQLIQTLGKMEESKLAPNTMSLLAAKAEHLKRRLALRRHWYTRLPGAVKQGAQGQYRQFGYGWKSMAQDLFL